MLEMEIKINYNNMGKTCFIILTMMDLDFHKKMNSYDINHK